jgi:hypothetical protein
MSERLKQSKFRCGAALICERMTARAESARPLPYGQVLSRSVFILPVDSEIGANHIVPHTHERRHTTLLMTSNVWISFVSTFCCLVSAFRVYVCLCVERSPAIDDDDDDDDGGGDDLDFTNSNASARLSANDSSPAAPAWAPMLVGASLETESVGSAHPRACPPAMATGFGGRRWMHEYTAKGESKHSNVRELQVAGRPASGTAGNLDEKGHAKICVFTWMSSAIFSFVLLFNRSNFNTRGGVGGSQWSVSKFSTL